MNADLLTLPGGLPSGGALCGQCAAAGPTCCTLSPGQEELCFPVSDMERTRIVEQVGLVRGAFTPQANSRAFVANLARLFPRDRDTLARLFPDGGQHLRLSVDSAGNCVFLRADGCSLPSPVRPYYCRLFPFWLAGARVTAFASPDCLIHRQGRTVHRMLALLDYSEAGVRELHGRLRLAWGLPPKEGMPFVTPSLVRFRP
ncbi:YkgJ family cysteine cluster protein [Solidesulfovibrio aerotolerans]|uniref:YkgJ family cysteine cluster protein n=1 Tax=Solidesulfovibrio aerotolerans TaxID=295255 RepID=UPI0031B5B485